MGEARIRFLVGRNTSVKSKMDFTMGKEPTRSLRAGRNRAYGGKFVTANRNPSADPHQY
jgi:hypothetical protein